MVSQAAPLVFAARSGEFSFGASVSDAFPGENLAFGSPKAFLFSLTLDLKIPYHGRNGKPFDDAGNAKKHGCVRVTADKIEFGASDLVIEDDLDTCSSVLESSFGLGLDDDDAVALLAGAQTFAIDTLEIWAA